MERELKELKAEVTSIKNLLILGLLNQEVQGKDIAKVLGITPGRLSQMFSTKKSKKKNAKKR